MRHAIDTFYDKAADSNAPSLKLIAMEARGAPEAIFEAEWTASASLVKAQDAHVSSGLLRLDGSGPYSQLTRIVGPVGQGFKGRCFAVEYRLNAAQAARKTWEARGYTLNKRRKAYVCPFGGKVCNGLISNACAYCRDLKGLPSSYEYRASNKRAREEDAAVDVDSE